VRRIVYSYSADSTTKIKPNTNSKHSLILANVSLLLLQQPANVAIKILSHEQEMGDRLYGTLLRWPGGGLLLYFITAGDSESSGHLSALIRSWYGERT